MKLKGLTEKSEENMRADIQFFNKIAPNMEARQLEEAINIVHRVGWKEDNRNRQQDM